MCQPPCTLYVMEHRILYINFLLLFQIWFPPAQTIVIYTLGSNCSLALGSECPGILNSECDSQGKCACRQPDYYLNVDFHACQKRAQYGSICLSVPAQTECAIVLSCVNIQATLGNYCVCPIGQFGYEKHTGMCRNVTTLRAENLHVYASPNETELSLAWDRPLNVSDPLTYRMVINGTEEITPINVTTYTLTNRQPGTPYQIQIYTSTFKDFGYTEEKIENNNPLQGTFCTKPAVPGSLATKIYSITSFTLQFFKSDGRVESYTVTVTANTSSVSRNESITSEEVVGDWRNATFYNLVPGELYDVTIKAISCGLESEERKDYFIIQPAIPGSLATNTFSTNNVTLQFNKSEGRVDSYSVTVTANTSRMSQNQFIRSGEVVGDWRNATFYSLVPGELYDVTIKAISCGLESEERIDYIIIQPAIPGSLVTNTFSTNNVTLQFSESEGRVERYNVTIIANSSGQSFTQLSISDGITDAWRNVAFYNLEPGEFYDVRIKAISWGVVSEDKLDYFFIRARCGSSCLSGGTRAGCTIGLTCVYIPAKSGNCCVCPSGQFGYQPYLGMCRHTTALRAENLRLNGPSNETDLSLAWDRPLNVSDPLTYRIVINGTEEITPINVTTYTLTNRQPGTPYQIQIYTSTFKDFGVTEEKIENNNPLQGTFCTKPAVPGSLATNTYSKTSVTLQFFKSDGRVESYIVTVTSNISQVSQNQSIKSDEVIGDKRNATFYNLVPGELYDVTIKANSCGQESERKMDYFIIQPAIPGSLATNTFSTPNVTLQFSESEGHVERYNVTIIANSSGQSFTKLCPSAGTTGVWRNVTFYNLDPGELYDVRIKAISWGVESEDKLDYFVIMAPYGWSCLSRTTPFECPIGLSCDYIQTKSETVCVCPSRQFGYQPHTGLCRNVTTLRADNLHLNGPPNETEISLAWDRPLNVSEPLTYRMVINGTEEITPINVTMYTLTNRQPGTPYLIQIYTSTFKDFGVLEEKIENNNPLQGTFCTKSASPGSLSTSTFSTSSVTLQFSTSDSRVESNSVTILAYSSNQASTQLSTTTAVPIGAIVGGVLVAHVSSLLLSL